MDRIPKTYQKFAERHGDVLKAYDRLSEKVREQGPLSAEETQLVKLAISVGAGMEGAMASQCRKALKMGLDAEKVEQVALLALPTLGLPRMMQAWKTVSNIIEGWHDTPE